MQRLDLKRGKPLVGGIARLLVILAAAIFLLKGRVQLGAELPLFVPDVPARVAEHEWPMVYPPDPPAGEGASFGVRAHAETLGLAMGDVAD